MKLLPILLVGLPAAACGGCAMTETTAQLPDAAFLVFHGAERGMVFRLDGGDPQSLLTSPGEVRYEIPPGKHALVVSAGDEVIVERSIFLSTSQVFEVAIPRR